MDKLDKNEREIVQKLRQIYEGSTQQDEGLLLETPDWKELNFYQRNTLTFQSAMFMPHEKQYKQALNLLGPEDVIMDAGAGDFRFAFLASRECKKVYAVEFNPTFVSKALSALAFDLPSNLIVICADWFNFAVPDDVTKIVVLVNNPRIPVSWQDKVLVMGDKDGVRAMVHAPPCAHINPDGSCRDEGEGGTLIFCNGEPDMDCYEPGKEGANE